MPEPQPSKEKIARFLKCFEVLSRFEAESQVIRGRTIFNAPEWPDKPDQAILDVRRWLTELAGTYDAR